MTSFQFAPTWEIAGLLDRDLVWACRLLDIVFHNRPIDKIIPKFSLWSECAQLAAIQVWPPVKRPQRRARGRGVGARCGRAARARGRGRGRARHDAHDVPAAAPKDGDITPGAEEAGPASEDDAVDGDGDADGSDVTADSVSDEFPEDGADESEMAEALAVLGKVIEEAHYTLLVLLVYFIAPKNE